MIQIIAQIILTLRKKKEFGVRMIGWLMVGKTIIHTYSVLHMYYLHMLPA